MSALVRDAAIPAELELGSDVEVEGERFNDVVARLRSEAEERKLFNPHLPPEWGGLGLGPLGMAIVSQECGVSGLASLGLNAMAPDEGNMHLLLHAGTTDQLERYLRPLAEGTVRSCFAMTERVAGADPMGLAATAESDGDGWVINGEKWFISGAAGAAFAIVVARTCEPMGKSSFSLFLVDADNPGWRVVREVPVMGTALPGGHCEVTLKDCRVGADALLGELGSGYRLAQVRLGPAHASRLMVLHTAYSIERDDEYRQEVSMSKVYISEILNRIVDRALQIHGSLASFWLEAGDDDDDDDDVLAGLNRVTRLDGFRTRAELVTRYEERTGRDARALDWYMVLATWKLAILLEGSYARHLAGMTDDPFFARMEKEVPALARRGLAIAAGTLS